jgi:hypothetical protein
MALTTVGSRSKSTKSSSSHKTRPPKGTRLKLKPLSRFKISPLIWLILGLFLLHGIYDVFSKVASSLGRFGLAKPLDYVPPLALLGLGICVALTSSKR